ncbi:MAG: PAS domain-containing protein [Blastocatellales bacterium]|nr:PAS domain-containing protein [Blastocatellales bacterium]
MSARSINIRRSAAHSLMGGAALAILTFACFRLRVNPTTAALLFLIIIVLASLAGDIIPAIAVAIIAYLCLDYYFTAPLFQVAMSETLDIVAPIAFISTALVITRLTAKVRNSFNEIEELKNQLRLAIDTIPGLVWSALPDGSAEFLNRRWLEFTGLSTEEGLDWSRRVDVHPEDRERLTEAWNRAIANGNPMEIEARLRSVSGDYRWLLIRAVPLRDESGKIIKWYGMSTDIEDRRRAEEQLRRSQAELSHVSRITTMGEIAASIAHEVNQPLAAIAANAGACLRWLSGDRPNLDEARAAASGIMRDATRAGDVIARIRGFLRKTDAEKKPLDINLAIREVIALVAKEIFENGVSLHMHLADDLPQVSGDRVQLQQVILNLAMNAIESMTGIAHRQRELIISTRRDGSGQVVVSIRDCGAGFDPVTADMIFDAFYTTKPQGLGLGLAISRSIVENHGGKLWAEANDGNGAVFHFTLPELE